LRSEPNAILLDAIRIPDGRRALNRDAVEQLKQSISRLGLITPISVCERTDLTEDEIAVLDRPPGMRTGAEIRPPEYDLVRLAPPRGVP
jgi:hypothetical protein